jgi:hypothetical protein
VLRVAGGQQLLVGDLPQPLAGRRRVDDVDHAIGRRTWASAALTTGANSVSVSRTFASPCSRMKAIEAGSRRMLSALSTAPHIGIP